MRMRFDVDWGVGRGGEGQTDMRIIVLKPNRAYLAWASDN